MVNIESKDNERPRLCLDQTGKSNKIFSYQILKTDKEMVASLDSKHNEFPVSKRSYPKIGTK